MRQNNNNGKNLEYNFIAGAPKTKQPAMRNLETNAGSK